MLKNHSQKQVYKKIAAENITRLITIKKNTLPNTFIFNFII